MLEGLRIGFIICCAAGLLNGVMNYKSFIPAAILGFTYTGSILLFGVFVYYMYMGLFT